MREIKGNEYFTKGTLVNRINKRIGEQESGTQQIEKVKGQSTLTRNKLCH